MAKCPIDGCEYTDDPECVEAHISGKKDDAHRGKSGFQYREAIREEGAEALESATVEVDEGEVEATDTSEEGEQSGDSGGDSEGRPSLDEGDRADLGSLVVDEDEQGDEQGDEVDDEVDEVALVEDDQDDDEPPGAGGVEVVDEDDADAPAVDDGGMGGWAVVIATIGLVAVALFGPGGGSSSEPEAETEAEDDEQNDEITPDSLWDE